MRLEKLTQNGFMKLKSDLERYQGDIDPHFDINNYESEDIFYNGEIIEIDKKKSFENKLVIGKYFLHVFPNEFFPDIKTWNWLSLLYYKQLLNVEKKIGALQRLFVDENFSYYPHTHLLKSPYDICKFYKDDLNKIKFLLLDKANINGSIYLEISKRQDIIKNHNFIEVACDFFYDKNTKSLKKGISKQSTVLRLIKVWKQYERSFDMYRMPSKKIINELLIKHDEFAQCIEA